MFFTTLFAKQLSNRLERKAHKNSRDTGSRQELKRRMKLYDHVRMQLQPFFTSIELQKLSRKLASLSCNFCAPLAITKGKLALSLFSIDIKHPNADIGRTFLIAIIIREKQKFAWKQMEIFLGKIYYSAKVAPPIIFPNRENQRRIKIVRRSHRDFHPRIPAAERAHRVSGWVRR